MDSVDLLDLRKKLYSYKKTGKSNVLSILHQIQTANFDSKSIEGSKIYKTIHTLSKLEETDIDADFTIQDINNIKQLAKSLFKKLKSPSADNSDRKQSTNSVSEQLSHPIISTNANSEELVEQLNLPKGFDLTRIKVIKRLIDTLMIGKDSVNALQSFTPTKYAKLCYRLEDEMFKKYQVQQYQNSIKQMIKYFQMDADGTVRIRLLSGLLPVQNAILMKAEDWTCDQRLKESRMLSKETIKSGDILHYKKIAQEINKNIALAQCNNCSEKQLKLVDEKQTRASDEPSTKFWECLNCGMAETTNG